MNENRLFAVAAGVVFYGLLAVFPAITAFVSLYGLVADPSTINERLSLATGVLPQGALNILDEQLTRPLHPIEPCLRRNREAQFCPAQSFALAFTLGTIFALMLALGAVVLAPIALSQLGLSSVNETLIALARWPILLGLVIYDRAAKAAENPSQVRKEVIHQAAHYAATMGIAPP
jgi:membrane protein